jgi:gas vesicle protein
MGIADSMKGITENIIASYDVRVKTVGDLVADTHKTLKGFAEERKKMSEEQAKNLADFMDGLLKSVEDMLKGFQRKHKNMSDDQAKSLADFVKNLNKDVGSMLKGFQTDRGKMSKELKGELAKEVKDIETYVKNKLKEFSDAHADMSKELKKDLDKYVAGIVSETKKLLGGFEDERKKMAANWQSMAATLAKKRGIKPKVEVEAKVRHVEGAIKEAVEEVEVDLEGKVLKFIKRHPEGVKVGDMEEPLGVARTRLGVIAKKLLDEGQVRKEENLYFPL